MHIKQAKLGFRTGVPGNASCRAGHTALLKHRAAARVAPGATAEMAISVERGGRQVACDNASISVRSLDTCTARDHQSPTCGL